MNPLQTTTPNAASSLEDRGITIERSFGEVIIARLYHSGQYQKKGMLTAELKQTVTQTRTYPGAKPTNSLQDSIFKPVAFNTEPVTYDPTTSTRVDWVNVPDTDAEGNPMTIEKVQAEFAALENPRIYRIISNHPILSPEDKAAIADPRLAVTIDDKADAQVLRNPQRADKPLALSLDSNGKVQYTRNVFKASIVEDVDLRTADVNDFYASPKIKQELSQVSGQIPAIPGQSIVF